MGDTSARRWNVPWAHLRRSPCGRARAVSISLVLAVAVGAAPVAAAADGTTIGVGFAGTCVFDGGLTGLVPQPGLRVTFSPDLTSVSGTGLCRVTVTVEESVTIDFTGNFGITCLGGEQAMGGYVDFNGPAPADQPSATAIVAGEPGDLQLVIQGSGFLGVADFAYADTGCPGSFSAPAAGDMTFESS